MKRYARSVRPLNSVSESKSVGGFGLDALSGFLFGFFDPLVDSSEEESESFKLFLSIHNLGNYSFERGTSTVSIIL